MHTFEGDATSLRKLRHPRVLSEVLPRRSDEPAVQVGYDRDRNEYFIREETRTYRFVTDDEAARVCGGRWAEISGPLKTTNFQSILIVDNPPDHQLFVGYNPDKKSYYIRESNAHERAVTPQKARKVAGEEQCEVLNPSQGATLTRVRQSGWQKMKRVLGGIFGGGGTEK